MEENNLGELPDIVKEYINWKFSEPYSQIPINVLFSGNNEDN